MTKIDFYVIEEAEERDDVPYMLTRTDEDILFDGGLG